MARVDSPSDAKAWQTALQRNLGIDTEQVVTSGQNALNSFYAGMPTVNAQAQTTSPSLLEQQQSTLYTAGVAAATDSEPGGTVYRLAGSAA